ncbi:hypothetical protein KIW84_011820 [Lathyrus oleraceus]|uniref:Uncharacterized protein n=1 Tax=Pisum sativum TaxID=3888 RepID=A0A9D5BG14_PEA|nr:hypothetical protein KIW84_011820 [Pisum sativum]
MSSKGPGLFSDIGKLSRDILTKDYNSDQQFTISSSTNSGIDLHSTLLKSRGLSSGDVAAQINHKNNTLIFKVDTESSVLTTFTLTGFVSYAKAVASIQLPDYKSGKIEVQYLHDHAGWGRGSEHVDEGVPAAGAGRGVLLRKRRAILQLVVGQRVLLKK